jgi:hypothetical protein
MIYVRDTFSFPHNDIYTGSNEGYLLHPYSDKEIIGQYLHVAYSLRNS